MASQVRRGVNRTDICTLRPVERRADGTIRVDAHLTKCGVFQYMQPDGTIRRELRLPEHVFEQASLDSFLGVPVTNDHPPGMITAKNAKQYAVGSQLGSIVKDDDHVRSRLSVFDGDTIDAMDAGKIQVSCGYTCDTIEKPGIHPLYGPYDAIQTNIRGNHIAIVDRGRAGLTAAVRMDGMMVIDGEWDESQHPRGEGGKFGEGGGGEVKSSPHGEKLVGQLKEARGQLERASSKGQHNNASAAKSKINTLAAQLEQEHPGHPAAKEAREHAAGTSTPARNPATEAAGRAIASRQAEQEKTIEHVARAVEASKGAQELSKKAAQASQTANSVRSKATHEAAQKAHQLASKAHTEAWKAAPAGEIKDNHKKLIQEHTRHAASHMTMAAKAPGPSSRGDGMGVASRVVLCKSGAMSLGMAPTARIELVVRTDSNPDPDDEASRNAAGENDAPPAPKRQPGVFADKGGDQVETYQGDPDDEDEDSETEDDADVPFPPKSAPPPAAGDDDDEDAPPAPAAGDDSDDAPPSDDEGDGDEVHPFRPGDGSMYDEEGNLTEQATRKIAASSFAVPGKMHLPIHDPRAVKHTMKDFGNYPFQASDEKHAAYNRISGKAKQFGINTAGFEKAHASKLDRIDRKDAMTEEMKALQAKAEKRKEKLVAAKARIDALEGEVASLKKDLEAAKAAPRTDSAEDVKKFNERIDAKIELLDKARATGAKVDSKMSDVEIMRATVKHVDGDDVPADKSEQYVLAMFEGAIKRAKKDAQDTAKGAQALAAARVAIANPATNPDNRSDAADDTDEEAAKSRLKAASNTMWARQENK